MWIWQGQIWTFPPFDLFFVCMPAISYKSTFSVSTCKCLPRLLSDSPPYVHSTVQTGWIIFAIFLLYSLFYSFSYLWCGLLNYFFHSRQPLWIHCMAHGLVWYIRTFLSIYELPPALLCAVVKILPQPKLDRGYMCSEFSRQASDRRFLGFTLASEHLTHSICSDSRT